MKKRILYVNYEDIVNKNGYFVDKTERRTPPCIMATDSFRMIF